MGVIYSNFRATFKCCFPPLSSSSSSSSSSSESLSPLSTCDNNKKKEPDHCNPSDGEAIELNLKVEDEQLNIVCDQIIMVPAKKFEINLNGNNVGIGGVITTGGGVGGVITTGGVGGGVGGLVGSGVVITTGGGSVRNIAGASGDAGGTGRTGSGGGGGGDEFGDDNNDIPLPVLYEIIVETVKYDGIERTIEILDKPIEMDAELMETYEQSLRELCIVGPIPGGNCQRKHNSIGECYRYVFRIAERIHFEEKSDIVECHWLTEDQLFPPIYVNKIVVKFTKIEHRNNFMIKFQLYNECIRNREIGCDRKGNLSVQCIYHLSAANNNLLSCIRRLKRYNAINNYEVINCEIFIRFIGERYYEKVVKVPIISDIH